jgi:uncharacterized protein (TIGR03435 family)
LDDAILDGLIARGMMKLQSRKAAVEILVIDHAEKVPAEPHL